MKKTHLATKKNYRVVCIKKLILRIYKQIFAKNVKTTHCI